MVAVATAMTNRNTAATMHASHLQKLRVPTHDLEENVERPEVSWATATQIVSQPKCEEGCLDTTAKVQEGKGKAKAVQGL